MQTKLVLLAAASSALAFNVPRQAATQTSLEDITPTDPCEKVGIELFSLVMGVPTPTDPAVLAFTKTYTNVVLETDYCVAITAAPASIASALSSYQSAVASTLRQHPDVLSVYSSCLKSYPYLDADGTVTVNPDKILSQLTEPVTCGTGTGTVTTTTTTTGSSGSQSTLTNSGASNTANAASTTTSRNAAGPRETGAVAAMGVAAAAFIGVVGML